MQKIKERIISFISKDEVNRQFFTEQITKFSTPPQDKFFYSGLLELFIHLTMKEEEARGHRGNILENYEHMNSKLDHEVGIRVAIVDYFSSAKRLIDAPILVEIHVFREAEKLAMVDGLTGIFNRRYFDLNLKKELRRASRYENDLSLLIFDIDNFKKFNDTNGHLFGDEILRRLASFLTQISREEDIVCRYGGEEFTAILPETTADGALRFAERVRTHLKKQDLFKEHNITLSGGIAPYPYGGKTATELIENADKAMYEAKFSGKDCTIIGTRDSRRRDRYKMTWKVYCQPMDHPAKGKRHETYTQDISFGGVRFELEDEYPLDTRLLLDIVPPSEKITILGKIVWSKKEKNNVYRYGIEFCDLRKEQIRKMAQLLPSDFFKPQDGEQTA